MQRNLISILLLTVVMTSIVSCSRNKSGIAIPKDASLAVLINTGSLTSKVSWQEIQQNEWFQKLYSEQNDSLSKKIMDNPSNSGIDIKSDLAFFVKKEGQGGYMALEGGVVDAAAFENFTTKLNKEEKVAKEGDVNVLVTGAKSLVAWTNNRFIYIMDASSPALTGSLNSNRYDSDAPPFSFQKDSLQKFAVQLFDLSGKKNLVNDDRFASLMKETGDIHYWVNAEQYYGNLGGFVSLLKVNVLFEGNAYGATINFENGKIALRSQAWFNKELKDLMEKYAGGKVSEATINRIPSKNVVAVFAMKYPPQGLKELIKLLGVDGFVNSFFSSVNYSTDEFVKANKGDVLLSVSDFELKPQEMTFHDQEYNEHTIRQNDMPSAKILFATSVNDKPAFDKLFSILQTKAQEFAPLTNDVHFQLNNEWFAASNSPEQINAFLKGGNNQLSFASRISGKSFGGYINVQQILKSAAPAVSDSSAKAAMGISINMWQDIIMTSGGEKGGAFTGEAEINLVDKSTNSLKQLNKYLDTIHKITHPKNNQSDVQARYSDPAAMSLAALAPVLHP